MRKNISMIFFFFSFSIQTNPRTDIILFLPGCWFSADSHDTGTGGQSWPLWPWCIYSTHIFQGQVSSSQRTGQKAWCSFNSKIITKSYLSSHYIILLNLVGIWRWGTGKWRSQGFCTKINICDEGDPWTKILSEICFAYGDITGILLLLPVSIFNISLILCMDNSPTRTAVDNLQFMVLINVCFYSTRWFWGPYCHVTAKLLPEELHQWEVQRQHPTMLCR